MTSFRVDQQDALRWLARWPDSSVDMVMVDPAYASLDRHRRIGTTTRLTAGSGAMALKQAGEPDAGFFPTIPNAMYVPLAREWRRVLRPHGCLVLFGDDFTQSHVAIPALSEVGFRPHGAGSKTYQREVIWDKRVIGMGYGTRRRHERIVVQQMPRPRPWRANPDYDGSFSSVQAFKAVRGGFKTEKPVGLLRALIRQFSHAGDLVIDCFLGSGSAGEAALRERRFFAGCDIVPATATSAHARLSAFGSGDFVLPVRGGQLAMGLT
ncbi:MAG: DNA-methyltransferase [Mycobacterium sp.]